MILSGGILTIWLIMVGVVFLGLICYGTLRIRLEKSRKKVPQTSHFVPPCEVLIPVTGTSPGQEDILSTLLTQTHPNYNVLFIVENKSDPANDVIDTLCGIHPHARKIFSGRSSLCGQKNHNLIAGVRQLRTETEIMVFCDANNMADSGWLLRFTQPLASNPKQVITTFRDFNLIPQTLWGVCQSIYAAFVLVLPRPVPSPWGGATAIHRKTFDALRVTEAWSRTVVDDVILGNLLEENGIPMVLDTGNRLRSPIGARRAKDFLDYMERQILYPRFANLIIWGGALVLNINLTGASIVALVSALALFPLKQMGFSLGLAAWAFLLAECLGVLLLRRVNPCRISVRKWLLAFYPCIFLTAFILLRSVWRRDIVWHGRRYQVGRKGVVLSVDDLE